MEERINIVARKYLEMWNDQYAVVNEREIVSYGVREAMRDIEGWIEGYDPNESRETAGCAEFSRGELLELYRGLAPSASFFCYTVNTDYLNVT